MLTAIIVAGGSSRRMGFDKTFALLAGKPVIAHAIGAFEACGAVEQIVVVGRSDRLREIEAVVANEQFAKVAAVIAGGVHRQDSVRAGIDRAASRASFIAVHDAARPLVRPSDIERTFRAAVQHEAAAIAAPVTDTLKRATSNHVVCGSVEREGLYAMQTPQIFARDLLIEAYRKVHAEAVLITDEVSAVERLGRDVMLVPNDGFNFKITYLRDLAFAEFVLQRRQQDSAAF
jgi:2-C-methyl-D-erythritol 4-phosphate cytidylyltransferase